jgi:hypothetical protein
MACSFCFVLHTYPRSINSVSSLLSDGLQNASSWSPVLFVAGIDFDNPPTFSSTLLASAPLALLLLSETAADGRDNVDTGRVADTATSK